MPDLSVVIPAFNEARRLPKTLTEILGALAPGDRAFEILIVDDGSTDDTAGEVARFAQIDPRVRIVSVPRNRGKGHAVRQGVAVAEGARILVADADGATPFEELAKLQEAIARGADVAIGTRAARDGRQTVKAHWYRRALGNVFNGLVTLLAVRGFTDTQCGFKLFTREAAGRIFPLARVDGYCFDVEVLVLARMLGLGAVEVAVDWADQPGGKVNLLVDPLLMFRDLLRIRWWHSTGAYEREVESPR